MKAKVFLAAAVLLFGANAAIAQPGRYGATPEDSVECVRNMSIYTDYVKQKNYESAYSFWKQTLNSCPPTVSVNLYIHGVTIMRYMIDKTTDPVLRKGRIDTLLNLYEQRMQYFPNTNKSDMYDRMAQEMRIYTPDNKDAILATYLKSIDAGRTQADPSTMVLAMQGMIEQSKENKKSAEEVMNFYDKISQYMNAQVAANPGNEKIAGAQQDINTLFATSGVASCDNLIAVFGPRFKENPNDKSLIVSIVTLLGQNDCTNNELYIQAAEAYHKLEPSAGSAYALAKMNLGKSDYPRCIECYRDAINLTSGTDTISQYLVEMGSVYLRYLNDVSHAASCAREAISKDSKNGKAYMLLGSIWAMQKCGGGDEIDRKAVFWVAVDYFQKAKQADPSLADDANKNINSYSQYFPTQAEAFMYDMMDGSSYTVNCGGMTERTTVRTRK